MPNTRVPARNLMSRVAAVVVVALLALGGYRFWIDVVIGYNPTSVPSCTWPLRVHGTATTEQAGLVRCYLRALAQHDADGLMAVADDDPPMRITGAQFAHLADAKAGVTSATFVPEPDDDAFVSVNIHYADGASESLGMTLANPASGHSWRLQIGSIVNPITNAPPPITTGPDAPSPASPASPASTATP